MHLNNLSRNDLLRALYALAAILVGFFVDPLWGIMLTVWFSLGFTLIFFGLTLSLPRRARIAWHITFLLYPLLETILKTMIYFNITNNFSLHLNAVEHFLWAFSMTFLLIPIFENHPLRNQESRFENFYKILIVVSLVTLIGNVNEFLDFLMRHLYEQNTVSLSHAYYFDTIRDMALNTLGSACAIFLIQKFFTK